ncbi:hypothetical protein NLI96_g2966 [Meripilus lineatus]|uniref:Uncharacterized protein n=1 Tax=Meripilus lineatus TaxID=2056292 RepID=A0AAD5YLF2_9APHY|nr:hypothetical protein NLI96_g2966 [Physisporinus lineatus]
MSLAMNIDTTINPSPHQASSMARGRQLNQEGLALRRAGDLAGAEAKDLEAIRVKEAAFGSSHITTAISYNSLGEVYIRMGRLDDAERYLNLALAVREKIGMRNDLAGTRDNLAQVYEMRGDLQKAKEYRRGSEDAMCCGNYNSIFQHADWKRHKAYCQPSP